MKLYSKGGHSIWNKMLNECLERRDINRLGKIRYQVQAGMDDLSKNHLNHPEMNVWFARLIKSIENTAKKIIKIKHPEPADNPLIANDEQWKKRIELKRKRDRELMQFMRENSY